MIKFIRQALIALLCFGGSASIAKVSDRTKCISLKNEPCLARPTTIQIRMNFINIY